MNLNPYLMFEGNCEEAINYYKDVFNGEITSLMRFSDGPPDMGFPEGLADKVMHSSLEFSGCLLQASDNMQNLECGNDFHLSVSLESRDEGQAVFASLADGGTVIMAFSEVFWGGTFGMVKDRFGKQWMISAPE